MLTALDQRLEGLERQVAAVVSAQTIAPLPPSMKPPTTRTRIISGIRRCAAHVGGLLRTLIHRGVRREKTASVHTPQQQQASHPTRAANVMSLMSVPVCEEHRARDFERSGVGRHPVEALCAPLPKRGRFTAKR